MNQGATVEPDYMLSARDLESVRAIPLDEPWARRRICIATQRGKAATAATKSFLAQLSSRPVTELKALFGRHHGAVSIDAMNAAIKARK